jgi:Cu+-exporting ATPase
MNKSEMITEEIKCLHCGADCGSDALMVDGNPFCCSGCAGVFKITNGNGQKGSGSCPSQTALNNPPQISRRARFDFLEDESVVESLKEFDDHELIQVRLSIPNIHCTSCVWMLEQLNEHYEGIIESRVNFIKKDLTVTLRKAKISVRDLVELLSSMGYEPNLSLKNLSGKKEEKKDYKLLLKLGLAGFAFGNIMLFSFPAYLSADETLIGIQYGLIFGLLNIALSIPVLIYSASDYLKSAWAAILRKGINLDVPISIGIIALFARSTYEVLSMTGEGYFDSFTGLIFFLLIGKWVQRKTFAQLSFDNDYKAYLPISVLTIDDDGKESSLAIGKLEIGQEILVRNQELVPVDSILKTEQVLVDYSFLSGESEPVSLKKGDVIYAGGKIIGSKAHMLVYKEVDQSHLTELWQNEAFEEDKDASVTSFADRISPYFTVSVLTVAVVSAGIWSFYDVSTAVSVFTAVLIIACPCALALSTPFTLNAVSNILGQNGIYLRNTQVVERLSKTDTIVFDKTGTITNSREAGILYVGSDLSDEDRVLIKSICSYSSNPVSDKIAS